MREKQADGTKYDAGLDSRLKANQTSMVDALITPHSYKLTECLGHNHKIVSSVPAYETQAQPVQARGRIVWNDAYSFQPHGPSYLDPVPDPGKGGGY